MDRISPNFVNVYIFIRYMLGLLSSIFCLFVTELLPLTDVRIVFLLNIFRTNGQNLTKLYKSDLSLCYSIEYFMTVKLLTKQRLEFLSLKGGCIGSPESTLVKMPHCWKPHVAAHISKAVLKCKV